MQLLKRILTAVLLIPIVLALVLRAPVAVLALVAALVALLAIQELLKLSEAYKIRPFQLADIHFRWLVFSVPGGESRTRDVRCSRPPCLPAPWLSPPLWRPLSFW